MDEYGRILNLQNHGIPCPYCEALSGHFSNCPLLTGGRKFAESLPPLWEEQKAYMYTPGNVPEITKADSDFLGEMRIKW